VHVPIDPGARGGYVTEPAPPEGGVYEWYQRSLRLLARGHPAAAATLLSRASPVEPGSRSILGALGRAHYDAERYAESMAASTALLALSSADDYAHVGLGLGLAAGRVGELPLAAEDLALAVPMPPALGHCARALHGVRDRQPAGPA
jgi:hypothetical protein